MTEYSEILSLLQSLSTKSPKKRYIKKVIVNRDIVCVHGLSYIAYMPNYNINYVPNNTNIPYLYAYKKPLSNKYIIFKSKHPYFGSKVFDFIQNVLNNLKIDNTKHGIYTFN